MISRRLYRKVVLKDLFPQSIYNAEFIRLEALKYIPKKYEIMIDPREGLEMNLDFLRRVFGVDYTQDYFKFLSKAKIVETHKSGVTFGMNDLKNQRVRTIEIPVIQTVNDASTQLHEFMHYIRVTKNPKSCFSLLYSELINILVQLLYGEYCDMNLGLSKDISVMFSEIDNRIAVDLRRNTSFYDLSYNYHLGPNPTVEEIISYNRYLAETLIMCKYFYSSVYALRVLALYQDNRGNIQKKIKALANGGLIVDDLLKQYNINMCDDATVDNVVGYMRYRTKQGNK